jgi:PTH1 family peptidyl-tRNA hydrolase
MFLHVGLGNPGKEYELHRHNIGFMAIDNLLEFYNIKIDKEKFNGSYAMHSSSVRKIILLKPQTFMNNSGTCVSSIMNYYSIKPSSVIVWHDEIDLEKGKVRVKFGGGHGGHNGIRDISKYIGDEYYRVRIGIGRPEKYITPSKWVLSPFYKEDLEKWLYSLLKIMAKESEKLLTDNSVDFMNKVSLDTNNSRNNL